MCGSISSSDSQFEGFGITNCGLKVSVTPLLEHSLHLRNLIEPEITGIFIVRHFVISLKSALKLKSFCPNKYDVLEHVNKNKLIVKIKWQNLPVSDFETDN